jgi:hypothetical protein
MMKDKTANQNPDDTKVLGDINPRRESSREHSSGQSSGSGGADRADDFERSGNAGNPGASDVTPERSGSRDVTEGVTGGTKTGGSRNLHSGSGASGSDIGNRPE